MITNRGYHVLLLLMVTLLSGKFGGALAAAPSAGQPSLIVQINNVRDQRNSRGEVALYLNGKRIPPHRTADRQPRNEIFELSLAEGVYQVRAVFRAKSFWKEKEFELETHDGQVRIYPGHVTLLTITLEKNADGSLVRKKNFFTESAQPLAQESARVPVTAPAATRQNEDASVSLPAQSAAARASDPAQERAPAVLVVPAPAAAEISQPQAAPPPATAPAHVLPASLPPGDPVPVAPSVEGKIALQINTVPSGADVIVDDRYLGQSPLITYVSRRQNHVIQISKPGHRDLIKMIDAQQLRTEETFFLIEKLEAQQ